EIGEVAEEGCDGEAEPSGDQVRNWRIAEHARIGFLGDSPDEIRHSVCTEHAREEVEDHALPHAYLSARPYAAASAWTASHLRANSMIVAMTFGSISSGAWPWSGTTTTSMLGWRAFIASTVSKLRMSELAPRMSITGTRVSASNWGHMVGIGRSALMAARLYARAGW